VGALMDSECDRLLGGVGAVEGGWLEEVDHGTCL
jgi:hypothetical protein